MWESEQLLWESEPAFWLREESFLLGDEASGFWLREQSSWRVELKDPREGSFVSRWGLQAQRVRERDLVHEEGRTEVEPAASRTCRQNRRANQRTSRKVATFFFFVYLGIECVCCEASSIK